jgi:hypothetical protein
MLSWQVREECFEIVHVYTHIEAKDARVNHRVALGRLLYRAAPAELVDDLRESWKIGQRLGIETKGCEIAGGATIG